MKCLSSVVLLLGAICFSSIEYKLDHICEINVAILF